MAAQGHIKGTRASLLYRLTAKVGPKRRASQAYGATAEGEMTYTASPTIKAINGTTEEEN